MIAFSGGDAKKYFKKLYWFIFNRITDDGYELIKKKKVKYKKKKKLTNRHTI